VAIGDQVVTQCGGKAYEHHETPMPNGIDEQNPGVTDGDGVCPGTEGPLGQEAFGGSCILACRR